MPAVLVSPWVAAGVFPDNKSVHFDHTSIGRYLCDKWGLAPLGDRMRQAHSIGLALRLNEPPRIDVLPQISPVPVAQVVPNQMPNENQIAIDLLSKYLDQPTTGPTPVNAFSAAPETKPDPDAIRARVMRFLNRG